MQNTIKSIFISLIILALFSQMRSVAQSIEIPCEVTPFSEDILQEESGDLLTISGNYDDGYVVHSTSEHFVEVAYESNTLSLSPQGDWLLFKEYDDENNVINLKLMNLENNNSYEMLYETNLQTRSITSFLWFGAPKILIKKITPGLSHLPVVVVDVRVKSLEYVFRPEWYELADRILESDTNPLLPDTYPTDGVIFRISPNGQYLLWDEGYPRAASIVYDAPRRQEALVVPDSNYWMFDPVWSQDSEKIIFMNRKNDIDQYYTLDVSSNTFDRVSDLDFGDEVNLDIEPGSWSPDNNYLAIRMTPELLQPGNLHIVDTTNGKVHFSCFTSTAEFRNFDFAWSHDSRFLAFEGVLDEQEGIYIYDVIENQVYEFEHQNRRVLGWSSSANQDQ